MGKTKKDEWQPPNLDCDNEDDKYEKIFKESDALEKIKTVAVLKKYCKENKISVKELLLFYMAESIQQSEDTLVEIKKNLEGIKDNLY